MQKSYVYSTKLRIETPRPHPCSLEVEDLTWPLYPSIFVSNYKGRTVFLTKMVLENERMKDRVLCCFRLGERYSEVDHHKDHSNLRTTEESYCDGLTNRSWRGSEVGNGDLIWEKTKVYLSCLQLEFEKETSRGDLVEHSTRKLDLDRGFWYVCKFSS